MLYDACATIHAGLRGALATAAGEPITIEPIAAFPLIKDLVTDVSWNYKQNKRIRPFKPRPREADGTLSWDDEL